MAKELIEMGRTRTVPAKVKTKDKNMSGTGSKMGVPLTEALPRSAKGTTFQAQGGGLPAEVTVTVGNKQRKFKKGTGAKSSKGIPAKVWRKSIAKANNVSDTQSNMKEIFSNISSNKLKQIQSLPANQLKDLFKVSGTTKPGRGLRSEVRKKIFDTPISNQQLEQAVNQDNVKQALKQGLFANDVDANKNLLTKRAKEALKRLDEDNRTVALPLGPSGQNNRGKRPNSFLRGLAQALNPEEDFTQNKSEKQMASAIMSRTHKGGKRKKSTKRRRRRKGRTRELQGKPSELGQTPRQRLFPLNFDVPTIVAGNVAGSIGAPVAVASGQVIFGTSRFANGLGLLGILTGIQWFTPIANQQAKSFIFGAWSATLPVVLDDLIDMAVKGTLRFLKRQDIGSESAAVALESQRSGTMATSAGIPSDLSGTKRSRALASPNMGQSAREQEDDQPAQREDVAGGGFPRLGQPLSQEQREILQNLNRVL